MSFMIKQNKGKHNTLEIYFYSAAWRLKSGIVLHVILPPVTSLAFFLVDQDFSELLQRSI